MWKRLGTEIQELHVAGIARKDIAAQLHVSASCVSYHLNPLVRQSHLEKARKRKSNWSKTEAGRKYMREYWNHRYHTDEAFRKKAIQAIKENTLRKKRVYHETQRHLLETLLKENNGRYTLGDLWIQAQKTMSRIMFNRFLNELKEAGKVTSTDDKLNWLVT